MVIPETGLRAAAADVVGVDRATAVGEQWLDRETGRLHGCS